MLVAEERALIALNPRTGRHRVALAVRKLIADGEAAAAIGSPLGR